MITMQVCLQPTSHFCSNTLAFLNVSETDRLRSPWSPLIADQLIKGPIKCGFKNTGFWSRGPLSRGILFALRNQDQVEVTSNSLPSSSDRRLGFVGAITGREWFVSNCKPFTFPFIRKPLSSLVILFPCCCPLNVYF